MKKLSLFLAFALLCSLCGCGKSVAVTVQEPEIGAVPQETTQQLPAAESAGEGISWRFEGNTLTLSGVGITDDYDLFTAPWDRAGNSFSVKKIVVGEGIRYLGNYAFAACCNLEEVVLPSTLRHIGESCFADCALLTTLTLPEGLMRLDARVFVGCGLTELVFPSTLCEIGGNCFSNCIDLKTVAVNEGLLTVGEDAFSDCDALTVTVPAGSRCEDALKSLCTVEERGQAVGDLRWSGEGWKLIDGVLTVNATEDYAASGANSAPWSCLAPAIERIEPAEGITHIGDYSFWNCGSCRSVSIPGSVESIGDYAFGACSALTELKLPAGLKSIGYGSFSFCSSLTALTLPEGLESVGADAFALCTGVTGVEKPASLREIGAGAFNFQGENTEELTE